MSELITGQYLSEFINRFQLQLPQPDNVLTHSHYFSATNRRAAVLIPIICRPEPTLLLTRRADHLRKHAGQVASRVGRPILTISH